ncbi:MAG: DUF721 domain-containing protein [Alphaproteobacteria bacterium]
MASNNTTAKQEPARRRGGMRPLAASLPAITRRVLGRRGFAEGGLIAEWPSIVGAAIAGRCQPAKLSLARPGRRQDGALKLRVEPGFALELQHLTPQIIERVNGHFGYAAIARLTLQQGPLNLSRRQPPPPARPLGAAEEAELRRQVATVEDEDVRGALERLGRAMRQRASR